MFTVYILYSEKHDKIYIGFSSNLEARINAHNSINNKGFTKRYMPWGIIYTEEFETKGEALVREKQLKSAKGRLFAWGIVDKTKKIIVGFISTNWRTGFNSPRATYLSY